MLREFGYACSRPILASFGGKNGDNRIDVLCVEQRKNRFCGLVSQGVSKAGVRKTWKNILRTRESYMLPICQILC